MEIRNQIQSNAEVIFGYGVVSILVLVEIRNQIPIVVFSFSARKVVSILVLVEIRNQIRDIDQRRSMFLKSFNPCFGGNQKSNSPGYIRNLNSGMFQSLFWWKSEIK